MSEPALLMLDEPSLGLARGVVGEIFAAIRKLREGGITLLIVEQNVRMALAVADYGYVLERGEIVIEGRAKVWPAILASWWPILAAYDFHPPGLAAYMIRFPQSRVLNACHVSHETDCRSREWPLMA